MTTAAGTVLPPVSTARSGSSEAAITISCWPVRRARSRSASTVPGWEQRANRPVRPTQISHFRRRVTGNPEPAGLLRCGDGNLRRFVARRERRRNRQAGHGGSPGTVCRCRVRPRPDVHRKRQRGPGQPRAAVDREGRARGTPAGAWPSSRRWRPEPSRGRLDSIGPKRGVEPGLLFVQFCSALGLRWARSEDPDELAVVTAPTLDRAFATWCFTVECDRLWRRAAALMDPAIRTAASPPTSWSVLRPAVARGLPATRLGSVVGLVLFLFRPKHDGRNADPHWQSGAHPARMGTDG